MVPSLGSIWGQFTPSMLVESFFPELTLPFPDKKLLHQLIPLGELFLRFIDGVLFVDVGLLKLLLQSPDVARGDQRPPFMISCCPSLEWRYSRNRRAAWGWGGFQSQSGIADCGHDWL